MRQALKIKSSLLAISIFVIVANCSSPFENCLYLENAICIEDQNTVIPRDNNPSNLIGLWKFDDKYAVDHSGNKNLFNPVPKVGPAQGGRGYSAFFNGVDMSVLTHIKAYESNEFTVSFWIFLLNGNMEGYRTILRKGADSQQMTPSIMLWPKDTRLHVRASTDELWNDGLDSTSYLQFRKWTHIAVSYSNELLQLYINGLLDQQTILKGHIKINEGPFYVGRDPWHGGVSCYLDNLKFYNTPLKQQYLMAEAGNSLYVTDGKIFSTLGCESCNFKSAINSCPDDYHLCSMQELFSGGYHTARSLGWFKYSLNFDGLIDRNNKDIWFRPDESTKIIAQAEHFNDPEIYKLGVCCVM